METRTFPTTYLLNIGMARNDNGLNGRYKPGTALNTKGALFNALRLASLVPMDTSFHPSDTEETAVLQFEKRPTRSQIMSLCKELAQDCIAQVSMPSAEGVLIGPLAKKWGKFNPSLFLLPNGRPLLSTGSGDKNIGAFGNGNQVNA